MLSIREVINESVEITDEFGNSLEFESYERGSEASVLGNLGVQVKVSIDGCMEGCIIKNGSGLVVQLSVFDIDELKNLHEKLGRWLSAK
jgi:hypothetical protein